VVSLAGAAGVAALVEAVLVGVLAGERVAPDPPPQPAIAMATTNSANATHLRVTARRAYPWFSQGKEASGHRSTVGSGVPDGGPCVNTNTAAVYSGMRHFLRVVESVMLTGA